MNGTTHYIYVTVKRAKPRVGLRILVLAGVGYAIWSEISRRKQEGKIDQLAFRMNKLERGEGE